MNDKKKELIRQAYMDEQLSVEEVIDFEGELCRSEKVEIEKDKQFERSLFSFLANDAECPDAVWQEVRDRIEIQSTSWFTGIRQKIFNLRLAAAVALLIFLIAAFVIRVGPTSNVTQAKHPVLFSGNLHEFSKPATLRGDPESIRQSLFDNGFYVSFGQPEKSADHSVEFLGMRYITMNNETVAQLYFSCCLRPVTVLISRNKQDFAEHYLQIENSFKTMFNASKKTDNYRIFIMGPHPPRHILDLFT